MFRIVVICSGKIFVCTINPSLIKFVDVIAFLKIYLCSLILDMYICISQKIYIQVSIGQIDIQKTKHKPQLTVDMSKWALELCINVYFMLQFNILYDS